MRTRAWGRGPGLGASKARSRFPHPAVEVSPPGVETETARLTITGGRAVVVEAHAGRDIDSQRRPSALTVETATRDPKPGLPRFICAHSPHDSAKWPRACTANVLRKPRRWPTDCQMAACVDQ